MHRKEILSFMCPSSTYTITESFMCLRLSTTCNWPAPHLQNRAPIARYSPFLNISPLPGHSFQCWTTLSVVDPIEHRENNNLNFALESLTMIINRISIIMMMITWSWGISPNFKTLGCFLSCCTGAVIFWSLLKCSVDTRQQRILYVFISVLNSSFSMHYMSPISLPLPYFQHTLFF